jgi:hypothetical protein
MYPDTYTYACIYINLFVNAVRTTSGNKISKKQKLVEIRTIWCAFF